MNRRCARVRKLLELAGVHALADDARAAEHLLNCDDCAELAESFAALDRAFAGLPEIDAPDATVARLLTRTELTERRRVAAGGPRRAGSSRNSALRWTRLLDQLRSHRLRLGLTAVPVALFIGCFLVIHLTDVGMEMREAAEASRLYVLKQVKFKTPPAEVVVPEPKTRKLPIPDPSPDEPEPVHDGLRTADGASGPRQDLDSRSLVEAQVAGSAGEEVVLTDQMDFIPDDNLILGIPIAPPPPEPVLPSLDEVLAKEEQSRKVGANRTELEAKPGPLDERIEGQEELGEREEADQLRGQLAELRRALAPAPADRDLDTKRPAEKDAPASTATDTTLARRFLAEREQVAGLGFQDPRGYWANTYLPGESELRRLASRLAAEDRNQIATLAGRGLKLHDTAALPSQPFDPPDRSALAVYLHADQRAVTARQRLLLEVGLKGSSRQSGSRPPMNVGVVLDLSNGILPATFDTVKALLMALSAAAEPGDRFSLTVAGCSGGLLVPPERFRHGPLTVALEEISDSLASSERGLDIGDALTTAYATVAADDDPSTPLGSSEVVLVSWSSHGGQLDALRQMAHSRAVEGIPLSVVAVGQPENLDALDELALAGQGTRRILDEPSEAEALVASELAAVSRIVARALRLNIRLAPGVQLVEVVGSKPLSAIQTQQVRDAESAIDRRIARNLGITADRGLDDDGIQIVIPSFYADDEHVILLDVVVPGPGPVADLEMRYKDLVGFRNGVANAHLSLERGSAPRTPLELNVFKNLLTADLAKELGRAADELRRGHDAAAQQRLGRELQLLEQLRCELPGLGSDRDLLSHIHLLEEYLSLLAGGAPMPDPARAYLADSLSYAARTQLMSPTRRLQ